MTMTRATAIEFAAVVLLLLALWALATWALTARVMAAGNVSEVEYEWKGERV